MALDSTIAQVLYCENPWDRAGVRESGYGVEL